MIIRIFKYVKERKRDTRSLQANRIAINVGNQYMLKKDIQVIRRNDYVGKIACGFFSLEISSVSIFLPGKLECPCPTYMTNCPFVIHQMDL